MKLVGLLLSFLTAPVRQRNLRLLLVLLAVFATLVAVFSALFHVLMAAEGQQHSWATAVYWTLVTMTTLGFGDITFQSDAGRIFSVVVLLSGTLFLLILLPFTFIQFVWVPWMTKRESERVPRQLSPDTAGHIVFTAAGSIEDVLIERAARAGVPYAILVSELEDGLRLHDRGYRVMVGPLDDPNTYRAARVEAAALVVATRSDTANTNIVFTVREISGGVPIIATANVPASVDILHLAGAGDVLQLGEDLGHAMVQRILDSGSRSRTLGTIAGVCIAEAVLPRHAPARTAAEIGDLTGVEVVGTWKRGEFAPVAESDDLLPGAVLVLAGSAEQLASYDAMWGQGGEAPGAVVVIGGGRVGRRVGASLAEAGVDYRIVERRAERVRDRSQYVIGDAAEIEVLNAAGLPRAAAVVITTHDDDVNIYLAIYARRLRPDIQVIARANLDRNVSTLYRAGADAVLSYASTGAAAIWNRFRPDASLLLAEGLDVFRVAVPRALVGRSIAGTEIAEATGCQVVAMVDGGGRARRRSARGAPLRADAELILIGDAADQARFRRVFG